MQAVTFHFFQGQDIIFKQITEQPMVCNADKPQQGKYDIVMIEGIWKGSLGVAPEPVIRSPEPQRSNQFKKLAQQLKNQYNIDGVVVLLNQKQVNQLGLETKYKFLDEIGIINEWYVISDKQAPQDVPAFIDLVARVVENNLKKGKRVLASCKNGKGRSGLFVAACLIYKGYNRLDAIKQVRKWIPGAIDSPAQQDFLQKLTFKLPKK